MALTLHAAPTVRSGTMNAVVRRMLRNESGLLAQILRRASALSLSDLETLGKLVDGSPAEGQVDWRLWLPVAERSDLAFDSKRRLPLASVLFKAGLRGDLPDAFVCFAASLDPLHDAAAHEALPGSSVRPWNRFYRLLATFETGTSVRSCARRSCVHILLKAKSASLCCELPVQGPQ